MWLLRTLKHHTEVHQGIWHLTMRDGIPWARPPGWIDPHARLLRNTYWDEVGDARDLGTRLRLGFDSPQSPPLADTG